MKRWIIAIALAVFAALLLRNGYSMVRYAGVAISYPYDLDYGEGIVWQQAREIMAGRGYAPLGVYPAIVFHYPPVYHLTSLGLAWLIGLDQLVAGRCVSVASTIVTMALCAFLTAKVVPAEMTRSVRIAAALVAPLIFISFAPVMLWFAFMRVDMLAGALSLGGLVLAIYAVRHPALIIGAALLFVLSIYTKQTSIAAPAAAFLMLCAMRSRLAVPLLMLCTVLGGTALAWLSSSTHGGFLRHILGYNLNRYAGGNGAVLTDLLRMQGLFLAVAVVGVAATVRRLHGATTDGATLAEWRLRHCGDIRVATVIATLAFFVLKLAMVPMVLKSGASYNYLIEWLSVVAIFAAIGIAPAIAVAFEGKAHASMLMVAAALMLPLQALHPVGWNLTRDTAQRQAAMLEPLVARIRAAKKPVISDDMILLIRAGRPVQWEPAIVAELSHSGKYDDRAFASLVRARRFAFFITQARRGEPLFDDRYNPVVADAMDEAYPNRQKIAGQIVHIP